MHLPPEILLKCCPPTHRSMLDVALGHTTTLRLHPRNRHLVEWANRTCTSAEIVLCSGRPLPTIRPELVTSLALVDTIPESLLRLRNLRKLTVAFPQASLHVPDKRKLSSFCPPTVESLTFIRVRIALDWLPEGCTSLSLTRCRDVDVGAVLGNHLIFLCLDNCNIGNDDLARILSGCPELASLQLPNNGALRVPFASSSMTQLRSLDILCCHGSSASQDVGVIVGAFPRLEELGLHLGGDCSTLIHLQKSLCRLCVRLSDESTAHQLATRVLPSLTLLQRLDVIVLRQGDVAAAEQRFRGLVSSVVVRCCGDVRAMASKGILNVGSLCDGLGLVLEK